MFCKECGEDNRNDRKFCTNCGTALRDYTKPRENLIFADEILKENVAKEKSRKKSTLLKIFISIFVILSIVLIAVSFFAKESLSDYFLYSGIGCVIVCFILIWIKIMLSKKSKLNS